METHKTIPQKHQKPSLKKPVEEEVKPDPPAIEEPCKDGKNITESKVALVEPGVPEIVEYDQLTEYHKLIYPWQQHCGKSEEIHCYPLDGFPLGIKDTIWLLHPHLQCANRWRP